MFPRQRLLHCNRCGHALQYHVPPDDNRERAVCMACEHIQYENPLNVVGTVPFAADGRVLLCRRAIEPRRGLWTLPAGFMELGETADEGALRETLEEAGARVRLGPLVALLNVVSVGQVHLFWRAELLHEDFEPGPESLEARLFAAAEIPWDELAFRTVRRALEHCLGGSTALLSERVG